jgi:hypothetical protein
MPSPRAIIRDIFDRGLDPTKPYTHKHLAGDGRLSPHASPPVASAITVAEPQKQEIQSPLLPDVSIETEPQVSTMSVPSALEFTTPELVTAQTVASKLVEVPVETAPGDRSSVSDVASSSDEVTVIASSKKNKKAKAEKPTV